MLHNSNICCYNLLFRLYLTLIFWKHYLCSRTSFYVFVKSCRLTVTDGGQRPLKAGLLEVVLWIAYWWLWKSKVSDCYYNCYCYHYVHRYIS